MEVRGQHCTVPPIGQHWDGLDCGLEPGPVPAASGFPNPVPRAWKVSPGDEHTLEKHQQKYTPPPPPAGKFPLLKNHSSPI